jgi:hypothetical protein
LKSTGNKQEPFVYGSLGGNDLPLVPAKPVATGPQADPQAAVRRDYELALQLGTRDGWNAFLSQYPDGFYANLAKGQLNKIAAEETRSTAAEKARLAEQEKARLAAEGAKQAEQARAAAAAKAAEQARLAAEKAKQIEMDKAAAAEKARIAEQEKARLAAEKAVAEKQERLAALSAPAAKPEQQAVIDLPRALQAELRRVGCNAGAVDGNWNAVSQKALDLFNKHAGMKLDVMTASADALDAVKGKTSRVCPLVCEFGFKADGDRCVKITCRSGDELNGDGTCEKIEVKKPTAKREEPKPKREPSERAKADGVPSKPQASGQVVCNQGGCRPVKPGCRLGGSTNWVGAGSGFSTGNGEVCN